MVEVTLSIRTLARNTYTLRSQHFEGLRIAMNRREEWGRFDPHVTADFASDTDMVTAFTVTAEPEIILPEWTLRSSADAAHGQAWDDMLRALTAHEEHHFDIFNTWARNLRRSQRRARPIRAADFEARWQEFMDDLDTAQERYDRTSAHGEREGVRLDDPPTR